MSKDFKGIDHGINQVDLREHAANGQVLEMKPIEIHHKSNGSLSDGPSFVVVMQHPLLTTFGQISLEMLNEGLADIDYEVARKKYKPDGMSDAEKTHTIQQADNADELFEAFDKIVEAQGSHKMYSAERLKEKYLMLRALVMSTKEMSKVPFNLITRTHGIRAKTMELLYYEVHGI